MQIHGPLNNLPISSRQADRAAASGSQQAGAERRVDVGRPTDSNLELHVSADGEFAQLAQRLRDVPEVREGLVQSVSQRLANGEYLTRAAAKNTAAAMIEVSNQASDRI